MNGAALTTEKSSAPPWLWLNITIKGRKQFFFEKKNQKTF